MTAEEARKAAREAEARQAERDRKSGAEKVTREVVDRAHAAAEDAIRRAVKAGSTRVRPNADKNWPKVPAAFVRLGEMCHVPPRLNPTQDEAFHAVVLGAVAWRLRADGFRATEVTDLDLGRGLWVSWDTRYAPLDEDAGTQ